MKILLLSWLFSIPFLANFIGIDIVLVSGQCQSDQQSLLLQMKNSLVFDSNLSVNLMQWRQGTDCCDWSGVDCDDLGRVIGLDLSNESISAEIENASGLFRLQHLQSLNLAYNSFNEAEIPSRLANLRNLRYLNLSNAGFSGQIPFAISSMTRLVTLDLSSNYLFGTSFFKLENPNLSVLVQNLKELRELYLDGVNISAHGNEWCQALSSSLPKLQVLSLSRCFLSGPIHPSLANLQSLSMIRLDQNSLSSPVPDFLADFSHLSSLRLSYCGLQGGFPEKIFQVPTLETLDLSSNALLQGSLPDFPKNNSLRTLILSYTNFSGKLPDSIGSLKNLSRIEVAGCNFTGPIPSSIANLSQSVYLDLSSNRFHGPIPSLPMSRNLKYLDLSRNGFTGMISSIVWEQLLNLVYVDLRYNSLNGSIPPSLFALPLLQKLQLANNQFQGQLPGFSSASSSLLGTLDLGGNRLEGPIPLSVFELKNLHVLILSFNKFNGTVGIDQIQRLGNLTRLDLSYNSLAVSASSRNSSFPPQINTLILASCKLKVIPNLKNQSQLLYLDLSHNQISGEIPYWIWEVGNGGLSHLNLSYNVLDGLEEPYSIPYLSVLDLHSNQLQGKIPHLPPNAAHVDFSNNNFTSSIPVEIGNFLRLAIFFSLSNNSLTGVIPDSICNATSLLVLDLSNNYFSGSIPRCLFKTNEKLGVVNLRRNNLNGTLSGTFPENCGLETLDLNGNQLQGVVPKSLANCNMLEVLDVGNNQFYDIFPCFLQKTSSLRVLVLRSNGFYGNIGCPGNDMSWPMLQIIDLASNKFTGRLQQKWLLNLKAMREAESQSVLKHLQYQFLLLNPTYYQDAVTVTSKGLEMKLLKILILFTSIDFSSNKFEGPIPEDMGLFRSLHVMNLSLNAFTGSIPSSFGSLQQIESLDLSMNNLSGRIPEQLKSLNFLSVLNFSYNHLVGRIPSSGQFQTFSSSSFLDNEGLCGFPLTNDCPTNSDEFRASAQDSSDEIDWFPIAISIGFAVGFGAVVSPLTFSKRVNKWYDHLINRFWKR